MLLYRLEFRESKSKHFKEALAFALELGATYGNGLVVLEIPEQDLLGTYRKMRTLFGFIQSWKGTLAFFNDLEVHPYQFILQAHRVYLCSLRTDRDPMNCRLHRDIIGWGCTRLTTVPYLISGSGIYKGNKRFWYNYGHFDKSGKWIIDKKLIAEKLIGQGREKVLYLCPHYDEMEVLGIVDQLPDHIIPDNITFMVHYAQKFVDGQLFEVPSNIRHVTRANYSGQKFLDIAPGGSLSKDVDVFGRIDLGSVMEDDI